jgi:hypothetical protein
MTCSSDITIGGYPLNIMRHSYSVWQHFKLEDRIIRSPSVSAENPRIDIEFAYSTTADVLRRRLGKAGFTRTTLEQEYERYYDAVCRTSGTLFFTHSSASAEARAEAFRAAKLDDWLNALAETVKTGVSRIRRNARVVEEPTNLLVNIITGSDEPFGDDLMPRHDLLGFPCSSLDNMAVALLEVVPGNAVCEQEVSMFVQFQGDTTFDDMRLRKSRRSQRRDAERGQPTPSSVQCQNDTTFDDI